LCILKERSSPHMEGARADGPPTAGPSRVLPAGACAPAASGCRRTHRRTVVHRGPRTRHGECHVDSDVAPDVVRRLPHGADANHWSAPVFVMLLVIVFHPMCSCCCYLGCARTGPDTSVQLLRARPVESLATVKRCRGILVAWGRRRRSAHLSDLQRDRLPGAGSGQADRDSERLPVWLTRIVESLCRDSARRLHEGQVQAAFDIARCSLSSLRPRRRRVRRSPVAIL
jgi:hypothetical protein